MRAGDVVRRLIDTADENIHLAALAAAVGIKGEQGIADDFAAVEALPGHVYRPVQSGGSLLTVFNEQLQRDVESGGDLAQHRQRGVHAATLYLPPHTHRDAGQLRCPIHTQSLGLADAVNISGHSLMQFHTVSSNILPVFSIILLKSGRFVNT